MAYRWLAKHVKFDKHFLWTVVCFSLFGSALRVVVDSVAAHKFSITPWNAWLAHTGIYNYGYFTVTPGIYVVVASIFFISLFLEMKKIVEAWKVGLGLALFHLFLLLPLLLINISHIVFVGLILGLAFIPYYLAKKDLGDPLSYAVFAHGLDGGATFVTIDIVSRFTSLHYGEQHVVGRFIDSIFHTYAVFYLLKVGVAYLIAKLIKQELKGEDLYFFLSIIVLLGLAPGVRDLLRMWCGV